MPYLGKQRKWRALYQVTSYSGLTSRKVVTTFFFFFFNMAKHQQHFYFGFLHLFYPPGLWTFEPKMIVASHLCRIKLRGGGKKS